MGIGFQGAQAQPPAFHPIRTTPDNVDYPQIEAASRITGTGMSVPQKVISNAHFEAYLDTSDQWIRERTGISERRWAEPTVAASELAEPAARDALARAGILPAELDGMIVATVTPDRVFPSTAAYLQKRLGAGPGVAFDLNAVCSGFVYALVAADGLIRSGVCRNVLIVGVDIYSRILDMSDRSTCVLFGDGAGAVVLSALSPGVNAAERVLTGSAAELSGIYHSLLGGDGSYADILCVPGGATAPRPDDAGAAEDSFVKMEGREVFKLAVRKLTEIHQEILLQTGLPAAAVDYFVSHQANKRILQSMARHLDVPEEKLPMNLDRYGNTSAATIPILLAEMEADGRLAAGKLLAVSAFGGGVTWGVSLIRW